jgi:hypothetical protein
MRKRVIDSLTTEELLSTRIKDLKLDLPVKYKAEILKLSNALKAKNIKWRPHFWASDEWFSPDGIGGIAYPFTLCHPKLIKLETHHLGHCEGKHTNEFFKLLAHETGHAIDNAYRLRKKKCRQKLFGLSGKKYPSSYRPKTNSLDFVQFLNDFYAQAHPDEDWAETFAVWLTSSNWKSKYKNSKALTKLNYIDEVMKGLTNVTDFKRTKKTYQTSSNDTRTVEQYLKDKKKNLKLNRPNFYSLKIPQKFFTQQVSTHKGILVTEFIAKNQKYLINKSLKDKWITKRCLKELEAECKNKRYRLKYNARRSEYIITKLIEDHFDDFIKQGRTRVYM